MLKRSLLIISLLIFTQLVIAANKITVVGLFRNKALVNIDGQQRLLTAGKVSPEGIMLISSTSKQAILEIDGIQHQFGLHDGITNNYQPPTGQAVVIITPDEGGMYRADGMINDKQVKFVVDTGATLISMNKHEAQRLGINYKDSKVKAMSNTASGVEEVTIVNLRKVKMGDIELYNVSAAVHDTDYPSVILLGNSFLGKIDMKREGRLLQLKKK